MSLSCEPRSCPLWIVHKTHSACIVFRLFVCGNLCAKKNIRTYDAKRSTNCTETAQRCSSKWCAPNLFLTVLKHWSICSISDNLRRASWHAPDVHKHYGNHLNRSRKHRIIQTSKITSLSGDRQSILGRGVVGQLKKTCQRSIFHNVAWHPKTMRFIVYMCGLNS